MAKRNEEEKTMVKGKGEEACAAADTKLEKFKDGPSRDKAYQALHSAFTKRSQRLAAVEKQLLALLEAEKERLLAAQDDCSQESGEEGEHAEGEDARERREEPCAVVFSPEERGEEEKRIAGEDAGEPREDPYALAPSPGEAGEEEDAEDVAAAQEAAGDDAAQSQESAELMWKARVGAFLMRYPEAAAHMRKIAEVLSSDEALDNHAYPLEEAWRRVRAGAGVKQEERVFAEATPAPALMNGAGRIPLTPSRKAKTLEEAAKMAREWMR